MVSQNYTGGKKALRQSAFESGTGGEWDSGIDIHNTAARENHAEDKPASNKM